MKSAKTYVTKPYCPQCGSFKPDTISATFCIPCINRGHYYRLVTNEADRLSRIRCWARFYSEHGYTSDEVKNIPWFNKFLLGRTFNKIHAIRQAGGSNV